MGLILKDLSKTYPNNNGITNLSLSLSHGLTVLLGPNGAGKTTLLRILATLIRPDKGTYYYNGIDAVKHPHEIRKILGYLPQEFGAFVHLNAREFLTYMAILKGLTLRQARGRVEEVMDLFNLRSYGRKPLGAYSKGMRQRVGLAQALLNDPALLLLDEPTAGLDPEECADIRNFLAQMSADRIVLVSTHLVADVETMAERIVVLNQGMLVIDTPAEAFVSAVEGKVWEWAEKRENLASLKQRHLVTGAINKGDAFFVRVVAAGEPPVPNARPVAPRCLDAYLYYIKEWVKQ
ncbi:MAG: ATP-binding cassette domain-containing protein [Firmicutes bacterium]|nr:ATP-binding cassette domain-containing protein [Bacillota bacterium]